MLNLLHNFCVYVRHVHVSTIAELKSKIKLRDELRTTKHKLQKEIEEAKIKEKNSSKDMKDLDEKIPREKDRVSNLESEVEQVRSELAKIEKEYEKSDIKLLELKNELNNARLQEISEQEIESLFSAKRTVEKQLEEQEQITIAGCEALKVNAQSIEESLAITGKFEAVFAAYQLDSVELKNKKKVEDLKVEINALKVSIGKHEQDIELMDQNIEMKSSNIAKLNKNREEARKLYNAKIAELNSELNRKNLLLHKLTTKEVALIATRDRLIENQQVVFQVAGNALKHVSSHMFNDSIQN